MSRYLVQFSSSWATRANLTPRATDRLSGIGFHSQLQCRFVACVADDDDPFVIDHNRLAETELPDGAGHSIHRCIVDTRVVFVGCNASEMALFDFHLTRILLISGLIIYLYFIHRPRGVQGASPVILAVCDLWSTCSVFQ